MAVERRDTRCCVQQNLTPNDGFLVRNHFDMPRLHPETYLLVVEGIGRCAASVTPR
ncbi:MAG: hypothetical protein M3O65_00995 [Actinomycetota bacterium]|nr:hypothetical protein [Actinomycetota bacterium]